MPQGLLPRMRPTTGNGMVWQRRLENKTVNPRRWVVDGKGEEKKKKKKDEGRTEQGGRRDQNILPNPASAPCRADSAASEEERASAWPRDLGRGDRTEDEGRKAA